ncbi:MAG: DNA-binding response regulator [Thermotoga sp.]|nr:response regulator transcription factor [Thermotogota bacterium]RKX56321.1 MAG: DNA-binding response regulator [Thermotoga sp.]
MKERILVVDDEPSIVELVSYNLKGEGYDVLKAYNAKEALKLMEKATIDLFIIDIMLPDMDGKELCRIIRERKKTQDKPIIFLTAKSSEFDRVVGFEIGGDDYVTKPFSIRELLARIKAIFRRMSYRTTHVEESKNNKIMAQNLEIDPDKYELRVRGKNINLTSLEFDLLHFLAKNEGKVFSRAELLSQIWNDDYGLDPRKIDVHIRRLRMKIEEDPSSPQYIITVRGRGYKFRDPEKDLSHPT